MALFQTVVCATDFSETADEALTASLADRVLRQASCPVLVVPARAFPAHSDPTHANAPRATKV